MTRTRPADAYETVGTGAGGASWAAAISAAIFGSALAASFDQPPVSRMLTKRIGRSAADSAPGGLGCQLEEEPALLRAGDDEVVVGLGGALEAPASRRQSSE